jgi:hypothetical protein
MILSCTDIKLYKLNNNFKEKRREKEDRRETEKGRKKKER